MKKTLKLLGLLLALCLLCSLFSLPALAESAHYTAPPLAESAYLKEFAKTGGWPPELIGSWVGYYMSTWGCWSFYPDGREVLTNFDWSSFNMIGTSKTLEPAHEMTFESTAEGDFWHLYDNENKGEFRKVSMPYVRLKAEKETAAAGMDPALIGTFGGKLDGVYTEWTFHGDGRFTQVIPYKELRENGTYLAGDGALAILLDGKIIKYPYKASKVSMFVEFPDTTVSLLKRTGPLVQIPNQWSIDFVELQVPTYREEYAKTGGWLPETIGAWVGQDFMNLCGQFSFYPDGRYDMTVFESPAYNRIGTSKTLEPADKGYVEGNILHIEDHGSKDNARRVSMPYARMKAEEETAAAGIDPAILGTHGGRMDGLYLEWTFHGDGRLTQVTPYEELTEHGTFVTGGGELAVLVGGKLIRCTYTASPNLLVLELPELERKLMTRKAGQLVQIPAQWGMN